MITLMAAVNRFGTLGLKGSMPWHSKEELKAFKTYTMGKDLLMGRVTYEGLPTTLRGRSIFVATHDKSYQNSVQDIDTFLDSYDKIDKECVVCGGAMIYKAVLARCDRLMLSFIKDNDVMGDAFFPSFSLNDFRIIKIESCREFDRYTYERVIR